MRVRTYRAMQLKQLKQLSVRPISRKEEPQYQQLMEEH
ncbi:MAG: hypothetical protein ACI9Y1_000988, partial [Lentisphaeria bacterium]